MDMTIEQLLYFDGLRSDYNTKINKHKNEIFQAQQKILSEEENIRHTQYKLDLMVTILNQIEPKWADRLSALEQPDET